MSIELPNTAKPGKRRYCIQSSLNINMLTVDYLGLHGNIFRNAVAGPALSGPDGPHTTKKKQRCQIFFI